MAFQVVLSRVINLLRVISGYFFSLITGRVIHWGKPLAISIEPNNTCNLRCPECPSGMKELTRSRGNMDPYTFYSIIDQLSPYLSYLTLYFQGEPYISPSFFEFIRYARSKRIFVSSSTNGHFLDGKSVQQTIQSGLNRLIISLDGADQESYSTYRVGGNLNKVLEGIRLLVNEKRRLKSKFPKVILQCLVLRSNEHELQEIKKLGKTLGVDKVTFKTAQFNDFQYGNPLMPENPKYSRYTFKLTTSPPLYRVKSAQPNSCFRMWSGCVFTWDGKVVPCCFDKDAIHILGDINKEPFAEIWKSETYKTFRATILKHRKSIEICNNCDQTF
ncbi:MAG: radical SAM/SPASM domain-containing protein [Bacteroidota bacterium]